MWLRVFVLILLGSMLYGCETMEAVSDSLGGIMDPLLETDNAEPPNELTEYVAELEPQVLWKETIGVGNDGMNLKLAPAVTAGKIIAADREGLVQARTLSNGELAWESDTEKPISAGPGIGQRALLLGTSDAEVIALNLEDGSMLWTQQVSSEVLATPRAQNNVAVIHSVDGRLIGLEESTGTHLWSYERSVPPLSLRGTANPVIEGDHVIEGYASGKLVSLRLGDGKVEWESNVVMAEGRSELERLVDLDADPLISDGVIYLASFQGGVFAVSVSDGQMIWWRRDLSAYAGLAGDWSYLYLSDDSSDVWALEQRNGATLWKQTDLHQRRLSAPAIYKNSIVIGDFEGYLHWLSQVDGRQLGRVQISDSPIVAKPLVVDDVLYVYAMDGTLAALVSD
ncbi:MAG: outer membrane protein assembly factor BamB [Methylococcaceae bacterium]|nr:outer membrane protein assembly factor BamB [Methylococcaceae bacterium]MCI0733757.1 outer membrane protein assembly factor BamB [Methylococcaceae bacterium]